MNLAPTLLTLALAAPAAVPTPMAETCPLHAAHMAAGQDHGAAVDARGDQVMGFDHARTSHHFRLLADGGVIEAAALDPADVASRDAIRRHLREIAGDFVRGDFSAPLAIHGVRPPGGETLALLADRVRYAVEEIPAGGRLRITTTDPVALAAAHDFLRFQIAEHRTGDALEVEP